MTMIDTTYDPLAIALDWARAGWHMVPVRHNPGGDDDKKPVMGRAWQERATNRINEIADYFTDAIIKYGVDGVSVGWAQGLDNCLTLDIDNKDEQAWPNFLAEVIDDGVRYETPRGSHLYYRNPKGAQAGNGTSNLPEKVGFIDIRGAGGQVVVARPGIEPFDHHRLDHLRAFPRAEWLVPYGGVGLHASNQQVKDFMAAHRGEQRSESSWKGVLTMTNPDLWDHSLDHGPSGRHNTALGRMTKFMEEAALGLYDAMEALNLHRQWFQAIKPESTGSEWRDMVPWAVGRALVQNPPTEVTDEDESLALGDNSIIDPSFWPVDLAGVMTGAIVAPSPSVLKRDDRQALFYRGQVNLIHADSGVGKGWVALMAAAQVLRAGSTVLMLDLEDVASSIVARLRQLGARDEEIAERFIYIRPAASFDRWAIEYLVQIVAERQPALVIIDSLGEAFGLEGIDENHDSEVGPWLRAVPRRLADVTYGEQAGPAVLIVDHVTKLNDNPLHPSGSKRKRAAVGGAAYWVQAPDPLSADKGGRLRLICAKDRHGTWKRGEHVADLVMTRDLTGAWVITLYSPLPTDDSARAKVATAINKAVTVLAELGKPTTQNSLTMAMEGRKETAIQAIRAAVDEGAIVVTEGPKGARILSLPSWGQGSE